MRRGQARESAGDLETRLSRVRSAVAARRSLLMEPQERPPLTAALLDAAALFDELRVPFALAGGLAAMVHGRARFTEDVDLVAVTGHRDVLAAHAEAMTRHHVDATCTSKLFHDSGVEVDLWKHEHADAIIARARPEQLAGRAVPVVEPTDLVAMKLRAGRPQDDYDVSELIRRGRVDEAQLATRVTPGQLQHYQDLKQRTPKE